MFASKGRAQLFLTRKNTPAYYGPPSGTKKKRVIRLSPSVNHIFVTDEKAKYANVLVPDKPSLPSLIQVLPIRA